MLLFTGSAVQGWVFLQNPPRSLNPRNSDDDPKSGFACSGSTLQNHSLNLEQAWNTWSTLQIQNRFIALAISSVAHGRRTSNRYKKTSSLVWMSVNASPALGGAKEANWKNQSCWFVSDLCEGWKSGDFPSYFKIESTVDLRTNIR